MIERSLTRSSLSSTPSTATTTQEGSEDGIVIKATGKNAKSPSTDWELDCYSRPVVVDGKKLWEILLIDSTESFRYVKTLPSNQVNSKELRRVIESVIDSVETKPDTIRFFRGAMFNMINIALSDVSVVAKPSRCTFALSSWLEQRHAIVYPAMEGYRGSMREKGQRATFLDIRVPRKLPDALRGEKYAFVGLPAFEFLDGGSISSENIGMGKLCTLPRNLPADAFIQGVVILTQRAKALATWLSGVEIVGMSCNLRKRTVVMETDIDTEYLMAKLNDVQRKEANIFEEGKAGMAGLHFISVQENEDEDPEGFWLLRDLPSGI
eukprot:CAMPEP_0194134254 /NCGR_PEP_ID=MMETSP0152-20130528/4334_1 /TAXON_ID=1049557 /ORGANISM="Thalassiothrix antarctica, Strain L6-D1" /LENGTH=322 /DNA_ID=CAMNT_0038829895 /DNA_START=203 /DNA_END=1171 /DNA_ORIENTATION=+